MAVLLAAYSLPGGTVLQIVLGDITDETTDAIVNPANEHLQLGGGVAGAIRRKGGASIQRECDAIGFTPTGAAAMTGGGELPARAVIHAVGPVWSGGGAGEEKLLASAVRRSLELAESQGFQSIALPAISSGIFGFPKERCAEIILGEIARFLHAAPGALRQVRCVNIDPDTAEEFRTACGRLFSRYPAAGSPDSV